MTVFDTARAYGRRDELGHNERLLARALRRCGAERERAHRDEGRHDATGRRLGAGRAREGDPRATARRASLRWTACRSTSTCIHAPDPRTPWRTSVRALARLVDDGLVQRVGVSNVNRGQLDEALELAPIAAVQVALSVFDDRALRGGVVERCAEAGSR